METNANTLVAQLNEVAYNYLSAMLIRQLTQIRLFNFEIQHIKGATHIVADFLFRRPRYLENIELDIAEENNNKDQIFAKLEAYELYLIEAIKEKENKAFIDLKLKKRSDILREMKERI